MQAVKGDAPLMLLNNYLSTFYVLIFFLHNVRYALLDLFGLLKKEEN